MKTIEKPFARSGYEKLETFLSQYDIVAQRLKNLENLRDTIQKGKLTPELYNFINMDKSLENLFVSIPAPADGVACEGLSEVQILAINEQIDAETENLKGILLAMWEMFVDWWNDWWDRNRWYRLKLQAYQAKWTNHGTEFGDVHDFRNVELVNLFTKRSWDDMFESSKTVSRIVDSIPEDFDKLTTWFETNRNDLTSSLTQFGMEINSEGYVVSRTPKHLRQNGSCHTMGWEWSDIESRTQQILGRMSNEINQRKLFNKIKRGFISKASENVKRFEFRLVTSLVKKNKEIILMLGMSLYQVLDAARRAETRKKYQIGK